MLLSPGVSTVKVVLRIFYYNIYNYKKQKDAEKNRKKARPAPHLDPHLKENIAKVGKEIYNSN